MPMLSVNLNKIALIRNTRSSGGPSVLEAAQICLAAGAGGITVHPRPDQRHTRYADVHELAALLREMPGAEFNVEGNPVPEFLTLVRAVRPMQCTLVPDAPEAITSDHGWDLAANGAWLQPLISELRQCGMRVSLFVDPVPSQIEHAKAIGADRIELYTEPYAQAHGTESMEAVLRRYATAAERARRLGLGVNAGHDLNVENLAAFCRAIPGVLEVSIGHALVSHALKVGLSRAVKDYLDVLRSAVRLIPSA